MPQIVSNIKFLNSRQPNFERDQVQTLAELYTYGGWNEGDSRYPNESSLTKIDLGHVTFVVETNKHYTYIKINELDGENNIIGHHYGWVEFNAIGAESSGQGGQGGGGELSVYAYFKSLVFKRGPVSPAPAKPEGGSFTSPVPEGWSDGVPAVTVTGEEAIWMSTRVFSSGGEQDASQQSEWTAPTLIADTEWKDFEFSELETLDSEHAEPNKQYPSDVATNGWSNTATEDTIWMAMRDVEAGAYKQGSRWEIVKIKGEDGEQAFKIKILGKLTNINDLESIPNPQYLDAYIIGNDVYVYDGDSWENSGPFRGEYDSSKDWAYLHVKYSDDGGQSFTAFGGEVPGKWVGTYCDYLIQDSNDVRDYFWKAVGGGDGFGYEYIYRLTIDDEAPDVPDDHTNSNGDDWQSFDFVPNNWSDDPGRIDSTWRWCWVCHRVCINGNWGEFKGAHGKTAAEGGKAALYAHYGSDAVASSASRNFMIFTWTALNSTLENPAPYVPIKPEDNVAKWNVIDNTLDLNEGQSWTWENEGQSGVWNVNPGNAQGKFLWMSTASFSEALEGQIVGHWSDPVRLTGDDGRNGTDGVDTAFGYRLCDTMEEFAALTAPTLSDPYDEDSFADSRWKDHPTGISPAHPIEAAAVGIFNKETLTWSYGSPFIWARWGEDGIDGDGVEYLFYIATEEDVVKSDILDEGDNKIGENIDLENLNWLPTTEAQLSEFLGGDDEKINSFYHDHFNEWLPEGSGWTDDPSDVGPFQPYEFVSIRRFQYDEVAKEGKWGLWSEPALWAKYSKDGKAGRSVFTSMAFTRTTIDLSGTKPKGGTVEQPIPTSTWSSSSENATEVEGITWYDTVPSDSNAPVWMTSRIFDDSLTGEGTGWKSPTKLQDTPEFQVEYTDEEVWDTTALPSLNDYIDFANFPYEGINESLWRQDALDATGAHWGDIGDPDDPNSTDVVDPWWMITARRDHNGVWSKWAIHKIKGEKGQPGTSISVKGSLDSYVDLGDPSGNPAGQVNHSTVSLGDCYVINGLLWIYDDNSTKTSPYSTDYVTDPTGTGQIQGDKYAGFSCQGQFKGDPGSNSWIHVRFANKADDQSTAVDSENRWYRYFYNSEVFIEFTGNSHSGIVPGKYAGIAITHDVNIAPTSILDYEWTEWRGDDIYGTEQIFTLSAGRPLTPVYGDSTIYSSVVSDPNSEVVYYGLSEEAARIALSSSYINSGIDASTGHLLVNVDLDGKAKDDDGYTPQLSLYCDKTVNSTGVYYIVGEPGGMVDGGVSYPDKREYFYRGSHNFSSVSGEVILMTVRYTVAAGKASGFYGPEEDDNKKWGYYVPVVRAEGTSSSETSTNWYTFDYVPEGWSDTPLSPTPDAHCWVSTRRLSDPENKEWNTPVIYSRYAHDGGDGIDGAVNEFAYHLGDRNDAPEINRAKAKQYAIENGRPESIINDVAGQEGVSSAAAWWASDASRDYCPADFDNGYWTDNPQGVADEDGQRVEYYIYRTREYDDEHNQYVWSDWSPVKVWSSWGQKGHDGDGVEYIFTLTKIFKTPSNPTPYTEVSGETVIDTEAVDGNNHSWSDYDYAPTIPVAADYDPEDLEFTEHQWYDDPQEINSTWRYQWVSMRRSHSDSEGNAQWSEFSNPVEWNRYTEDGKDGRTEEFIYFLSKYNSNDQPIVPTIDDSRAYKLVDGSPDIKTSNFDWQDLEDYVPGLGNPEAWVGRFDPTQYNNIWWSDNPLAISEEWPIEYMSSRFKKDGTWSSWSTPVPWSTWGKTGHDGDGVEYIFVRTANKEVVPVLTNETGAFTDNNNKSWTDDDFVPRTSIPGTDPVEYLDWTDNPQGTTKDLRVEWVSIRKTYEGVWAASGDRKCWSEPKIWNEYDDSLLEERVYHYGGKTDDPVLNQVRNYRGQITNSSGETLQQLDGFIPSDVPPEASTGYYDGEGDFDPNGWSPLPKGITPENRYEYEAIRKKNPETGVWGQFNGPYLYAAWGEDGDSVEFVFWMLTSDQHSVVQTTHQNGGVIEPYGIENDSYDSGTHNPSEAEYRPQITIGSSSLRAQDDPSDLTSEKPYLYASKRTKRNGEWGDFCDIFLYSQLVLEPEYSCTLDLEEDTQGVSVEEIEGDKFRALKKSNGIGLTDMELRYGASAMIVGKVWVAPLVWNKSEGKYQRGTDVLVWDVTVNDGASTTTNISIPTYVGSSDVNIIRFSVNRADTFYNAWFSWGATDLIFDKDGDGNPRDINFIIRAGGSTTEGETNKTGEATFKIRPSVGDTVYEIDPWYNLFKKGTTGNNPFSQQSLPFYLYKNQVETGKNWLNKTDWDTNGHLSVRYKVDQLDVPDSSATWTTVSGTFGATDTIKESNTSDNKWTLKENIYHEGLQDEEPYVLLTVFLYKSESGTKTSLIGDPVDGITVQFLNDGWVSDEEYIPVVYNGKDGKRGDYYKEETAYFLSQSDQAPNAPASNVTLVTPSGTDSNDADKWLDTPVSPTPTYRYLYAAKRLNRYWGDNDSERDAAVDTISEAGTWETPFLFASRSVGIQGDPGRGIAGRTEYYQWTAIESAPSKTPRTNWTSGSVPSAGNNKFLWNFEVITYTVEPFEEETPVELIGSVSEDGRSITGLTEYYLWSGSNSGITIEGNTWYEADELPNPTGNQIYLWNYEEVSYDKEPLLVQTDPIVIAVNGKSISSVTEYYKWTATEAEKPSNSNTSGWTANTIPASSTVTNAKYLWNFESVSYNYGNPTNTPVALLTTLVDDGRGIASIDEYYIWWNSGTTAPAKNASGWYQSNNPNSPTETNKYLWNYEVIHFDDGSADLETDPVLLSQNGTDGAVGRGINSIQEYYLWTASSTLTTGSTNAYQAHTATISNPNSPAEGTYGWDTNNNSKWYTSPTYITEAQIASKGYKYLWNFEILSYTSGTSTTRTSPAIIGTIGEDGRGISGVAEYYLWSENSSDVSDGGQSGTGWVTAANLTPPTGNEKYLWNYEVVTYTSGTPSYSISTPIIISTKGDKGDDGKYSQFVYFRSRLELSSSYTIQENGTDSGNYGFYDGTNTTWTTNADGEALPVFKYTRSSNTFVVSSIQANTSTSTSTYNPFRVSSTSISTVTDDPQGANDIWRWEYESMGTYDPSTSTWKFSKPALHSYKATNGTNGEPGTREFCMYRAGARSSNYTLSTNPTNVKALNQIGWVIDYNSVTTSDSNPVIWAISTEIPVNEAPPGLTDETNRTWSEPRVVFEKGEKGASIAGPAVRGPVRWEEASTNPARAWLSGKGESGFTDSDKWIDIVTRTTNTGGQEVTNYYICIKAHTHTGSTSDVYVPGRNNSEYWANADAQYKFVATEVLLANSAKINVLSNNALLLMDNQDEVVGGARGGDSADDVIFWAGTEESNMTALESAIPSAPFRVTFDGSLTSTKGTIGGWKINPSSLAGYGGYPDNHYSAPYSSGTPEISLDYKYYSSEREYQTQSKLSSDGLSGNVTLSGKVEVASGNGQWLNYSNTGSFSYDSSKVEIHKSGTFPVYNRGIASISSESSYYSALSCDTLELSRGDNTYSSNIIITTRGTRTYSDGITLRSSSSSGGTYNTSETSITSGGVYTGFVSGTEAIIDTLNDQEIGSSSLVTIPKGGISVKMVFVTDDSGLFSKGSTNWMFNSDLDLGIPNSASNSPIVNSSTQEYRIGTYGTGVYTTNVTRRGDTIYIEI